MIAVSLCATMMLTQPDFVSETNAWRKERETSLMRPNGWLAVAGLFWLKEGEQTIGSDPKSDIVLPASAPKLAGTIRFTRGVASLAPASGVVVTANGSPISGPLKSDADGRPDRVHVGDLTFSVIKRGKRTGLRLWDPNSKARREFVGCKWFAPDQALVVTAKFVAHSPVRTIPILTILGDTEPTANPGYVEFTLKGRRHRLEALAEGDGLFFNFKDRTSGKETYPAGRFLNADGPKDGKVVLDFNQAVNPPCAFTAFATCPLPPKGNSLSVRIPAGELSTHPVH